MYADAACRQVNSDELECLYMSLGRGVWHLQYVEDALNTLITIKHEVKTPGRVSKVEANALLAKHRQNTLGTSLKITKAESLLPSSLLDELSKFKDERDWLVHRSQNSHGDLLYTDAGRAKTFARLDAFAEEALRLQTAVLQEIDLFVAAAGVDIGAAERSARSSLARLRGAA